MPGALYLVDSNVLLRWIKPDDRDYPLVVSAIEIALQNDAVRVTHPRMLRSSGTPAPGHSSATDMVCLRKRPTGEPLFSSASCDCCRIVWRFIRNGGDSWLPTTFPEFRFTTRD